MTESRATREAFAKEQRLRKLCAILAIQADLQEALVRIVKHPCVDIESLGAANIFGD